MRRDKCRHLDDSDEDEAYFTYRPLSNLPTPPPTFSTARDGPATALEDGECLDPKLLGAAIHLTNLIPPAASVTTPSVPVVQAILSRACLPLDTIALAVCVLDALDHKFSLNWRISCPLVISGPAPSPRWQADSRDPITPPIEQLHIDSVDPELIVLTALVIAVKFVNDPQNPTQYYCSAWGKNTWSYEQLNVTERCIMENLNYRILPLCDEELIAEAMVDMQLAARQAFPGISHLSDLGTEQPGESSTESVEPVSYSGKAVLGLGFQFTPADTPRSAEDEDMLRTGVDLQETYIREGDMEAVS